MYFIYSRSTMDFWGQRNCATRPPKIHSWQSVNKYTLQGSQYTVLSTEQPLTATDELMTLFKKFWKNWNFWKKKFWNFWKKFFWTFVKNVCRGAVPVNVCRGAVPVIDFKNWNLENWNFWNFWKKFFFTFFTYGQGSPLDHRLIRFLFTYGQPPPLDHR